MRIPENAWPDTPAARGTLFFAQAMQVFLDRDTFEGFRAYSLDTISRLDEIAVVAADILALRVPSDAIQVVADELAWSLKMDQSAQQIAPRECELAIDTCAVAKKDPRDFAELSALLRKRLYPRYRDELRNWVSSCVNDPIDRHILFAASGFLASHLVNDGHNRNYLLKKLQERFFSKEMKKVGGATVKSFISEVYSERKNYKVCHGVSDQFATALEKRAGWELVDHADLSQKLRDSVEAWNLGRFSKFAIRREYSADPYSAALAVESEVRRLKSFFLIPTRRIALGWSRQCSVYRPNGSSMHALVHVDSHLQPKELDGAPSISLLTQTTSLQRKMDGAFDRPSSDRIYRALATAATATRTFEVLLSEPKESGVRIIHFEKQIVPAVCITYHRRIFSAVYRQLRAAHGSAFSSIIWSKNLEGRGPAISRFAKLVILPEFAALRQELLKVCASNPLALHRLARLERYFGTPKAMRDTLVDHSKRVSWQVHRIYRVRNSLVHAGIAPPYADTLVVNALDYLRTTLTNVIRVSARESGPSDLDSILSELKLDWLMLQKKLSLAGNKFDDPLAHQVIGAL